MKIIIKTKLITTRLILAMINLQKIFIKKIELPIGRYFANPKMWCQIVPSIWAKEKKN